MPKCVKRPFHRHFPPLTKRSPFGREPLLVGVALTARTEFPFSDSATPTLRSPSAPGRRLESAAAPGADAPSKTLVPKPPGEVSRLSRGGYNLEEKLGWKKTDYITVQKGIRELAKAHLDMRLIISEQRASDLRAVLRSAKERFPLLEEYEGDWVAEDFLSTMLKNSSDRHRRNTGKINGSQGERRATAIGRRWKDRNQGQGATPSRRKDDDDAHDGVESEDEDEDEDGEGDDR